MLYWAMAAGKNCAAWTLVAHSAGTGAPVQVVEVGAIALRTSEAMSVERDASSAKDLGDGVGLAMAKAARMAVMRKKRFDNMVSVFMSCGVFVRSGFGYAGRRSFEIVVTIALSSRLRGCVKQVLWW
jgi:hypothetical protein